MLRATPRRTDTLKDRKRILNELSKPRTANEVIDILFDKDVKSGDINKMSWKYYVHLNKLFSPMETSGLIENNGLKLGPTKKFEKVWVRSANNARKSNI